MPKLTFLQAIHAAQQEEMRRDASVFIMGEDVEANLFGTTSGFIEEFGSERVRNTPIAEAGMTGVAAGAAMVGMRPIVDYTIAPFLYPAFDQIVSIAAKSSYLYGGQAKVPVVLRSNMLYGRGNAAQHSDRPYALFMHVPGLKIIVPSNAYEMKGLLKAAIRDDNPVLSFEDGNLWTHPSEIPDDDDLVIPLGKANIARTGDDVTVVALGATVNKALEAAAELEGDGVSVEVVDLRTAAPLDRETVLASVRKTGRLVAADVAWLTCGASSEIAATVASEAFWDLRAPIVRLATPDTHIPFSPPLEAGLYPDAGQIADGIRRTLA